jgi:hypothetical protein
MNLIDNAHLEWEHYTGDERFDYPISYWGAVLSVRPGHIDLLYRWDPDSYCHFHRHLCGTASIVLAGELHITDFVDGKESGTLIRSVGDYIHKPENDVHMERGGSEGALVLFNLHTRDGRLTDQLAPDFTVLNTITMNNFALQMQKGDNVK